MTELEILKKVVERQSNRIAALTLALDMAHSQIDLMNEETQEETEKDPV